jgi:photosystem II stability/assembly factor-like uncharacterized protein
MNTMNKHSHVQRAASWLFACTSLTLFAFLFAACSSSSGTTSATPTPAPVNGFGVSSNHVHSLLTLPNHVVLLATHYGIYRSSDGGTNWQQTSGGPNQLMQGVMDYSLSVSPVNSQRLYVLTEPSVTTPHSGVLGLYTSADQGRTWKLTVKTSDFTQSLTGLYFVSAGNETPDQTYIYILSQGAHGLKVSTDDGQHFSSTGTLPFGVILGMLAVPNAPGQLLAYGSDGLARSTDSGKHWQVVPGIQGGIYSVTTAGPHSPIYAGGDNGISVSNDEGKTFTSVNTQATYSFLTAAPSQPQTLYGKTGTAIYRSINAGKSWTQLPPMKGTLASLAVDTSNPSNLYLSLSYPVQMYHLDQNTWASLTPKA